MNRLEEVEQHNSHFDIEQLQQAAALQSQTDQLEKNLVDLKASLSGLEGNFNGKAGPAK